MLNINEEYEVTIKKFGDNLEGISDINNFPIYVENTVPKDVVLVKIVKVKKAFAIAKIVKMIEASEYRKNPECGIFDECGGCNLQNIKYDKELEYKMKKVKDSINRIYSQKNIEVKQIISMDKPFRYRNKGKFVIKELDGKTTIGFYKNQSKDIVEVNDCLIQSEDTSNILKLISDFIHKYKIRPYDEYNNKGTLKYVFVRRGYSTEEIMVCIGINGKILQNKEELVKTLSQVESIKSVSINLENNKHQEGAYPKNIVIFGNSVINDCIGDVNFQISANSFYQANSLQTKILYDTVVEYANFKNTDIVLDCYCGIGTISLYIAKYVKKVIGIEIAKPSLNDAIINAEINNIENSEFYLGDSGEVIESLLEDGIYADIVILDPPRKGCDLKTINSLIKYNCKKIIYVSCEPTTMSRDVKILCNNGYNIKKVQPIDCFPFTVHVECVVLLEKN